MDRIIRNISPSKSIRAFAEASGLLVTGASDYHGAGKPNRIGENTTVPEVYQAIVAAGRIEVVS